MDPQHLLSLIIDAKDRKDVLIVINACLQVAQQEYAVNVLSGRRFYDIGEALLTHADQQFLGVLSFKEIRTLFHDIFLAGPMADALLLLFQHIDKPRGLTFKETSALLIHFLDKRLISLFCAFCKSNTGLGLDRDFIDRVLRACVSLPGLIANRSSQGQPFLASKDLALFSVSGYAKILAVACSKALCHIHDCLVASQDVSMLFCSHLLSRIQMSGLGGSVMNLLVPFLQQKCTTDFIWPRISQKLFGGVSGQALESCVTSVLERAKSGKAACQLLGDLVEKQSGLRYLLTNKLPLMRYSESLTVLRNVVGYLGAAAERHHLLKDLLLKLFKLWSDRSVITHMPYEQHIYQSKGIVLCVRALSPVDIDNIRTEVTQYLLTGIQYHIESPSQNVRRVGMVVAEILTPVFTPSGNEKDNVLKFDYVDDAVTQSLRKLMNDDPIQEQVEDFSVEDNQLLIEKFEQELCLQDTSVLQPIASQTENTALDSDDDLEPYEIKEEMSHKAPKYIRECMEGLFEDKDGTKFEACLKTLEPLIRKRAVGFQDIAVELTKILLHLENRFAMDGFATMRDKAMVACAVMMPSEVVGYLTKEFYAPNYSLSHRVDCLDVLLEAAKELSTPTDEHMVIEIKPLPELPVWRQVIQQRVESSTKRRRTHATKVLAVSNNRFSNVASDFFFPLLAFYDQKQNTFDPTGRDFLVLGRLLYTLGSLIHLSEHSPRLLPMCKLLLEALWVLRFHDEGFIRQGVTFCLSMVVTIVPPRLLVTELGVMLEFAAWLTDAAEHDPDAEQQRMCAQTLMMLQSKMKQGMKNVIGIGEGPLVQIVES